MAIEEQQQAVKATKARAPRIRKPSTHPPYFEMISDAISTLKERNGSSQQAIQKFIEEKHKQLAPNFRKLLLVNLKKSVANDKLVKVKASYKLKSARKSSGDGAAVAPPKKAAVKPKAKAATAEKTKAGAKRKAPAEKKPTKAAKTAAKSTPAKKAAVPAKKAAVPAKKKAATPVKKAVPAKKKAATPVKKAAVAKKAAARGGAKSPATRASARKSKR